MKHNAHDNEIEAVFECRWVELPDNDLAVATFVLAPSFVFGKKFNVLELSDAPVVSPEFPDRVSVRASMSKLLYTLMLRVQQGAESAGADQPPWALVDGSAIEISSGRVLDLGEVFPFV